MIRLILIFLLTNAIQADQHVDSSLDLSNITGPSYRGTALSIKLPSNYRECPIAKNVRKFVHLIDNSDVFLDKTLLMKELFERNTYMIVLTAPSKWGKSVLLDMLRCFFELRIDSTGLISPIEENPFRKFFTLGEITWNNKTEMLRDPPLISQHPVIVERYQGRFPVIYVDLKSVEGDNFTEIYDKIRTVLSQVFLKHKYMVTVLRNAAADNRFPPDRRAKFAQDLSLYENFTFPDSPSHRYMDLTTSLKFLTRIIWEHFHKKIFVMIDDYDISYKTMILREKFGEKDGERIWRFFTDLLTTTFFGNGCLKKAIVTGTFHVGRASSFVPRIALYYDIINNPFYKYFGFSSEDVTKLLRHFNIEMESKLVQIWYNGFHVGEDLKWSVYSPPSVIEFLYKQRARIYFNSQNHPNEIDFLAVLMKIKPLRETFEIILNKERKYIYRDRLCFNKEGAYKLKKISDYSTMRKIPQILFEQTLSQMVAYGYLAFTGFRTLPGNPLFDNGRCYVGIPNVELLNDLMEKLWERYNEEFPAAEEPLRVLSQALAFYTVTEHATIKRLEEGFPPLMRSVGLYTNSSLKGLVVKEHTLNSMLNYLCLRMRIYYRYKTTVFTSPFKPKMTLRKEDSSVIVGVKYNFSSEVDPLEMARASVHFYKDVRRIKLIGIEFLPDETVKIYEEKVYPKGMAAVKQAKKISIEITENLEYVSYLRNQTMMKNPTSGPEEPLISQKSETLVTDIQTSETVKPTQQKNESQPILI